MRERGAAQKCCSVELRFVLIVYMSGALSDPAAREFCGGPKTSSRDIGSEVDDDDDVLRDMTDDEMTGSELSALELDCVDELDLDGL